MFERGIRLKSKTFSCQAVLLDLDGTLVDTSADLWHALQNAFARHGFAPISKPIFFDTLHFGINESTKRILKDHGADDDAIWQVAEDYKKIYRLLNHSNTALYEGVFPLLTRLRECGIKLGICTNKESDLSAEILQTLQIGHFFDVVLGIDQVSEPKPSPKPLEQALLALGTPSEDCVFIGDSKIDSMASAAAGISFLLHRKGFGAVQVPASGLDGYFDNYSEIDVIGNR